MGARDIVLREGASALQLSFHLSITFEISWLQLTLQSTIFFFITIFLALT